MTPRDLTALVTTLRGGYLDWTRYFPAFLQLRLWFPFTRSSQVEKHQSSVFSVRFFPWLFFSSLNPSPLTYDVIDYLLPSPAATSEFVER
jgi:hypothetical protein